MIFFKDKALYIKKLDKNKDGDVYILFFDMFSTSKTIDDLFDHGRLLREAWAKSKRRIYPLF